MNNLKKTLNQSNRDNRFEHWEKIWSSSSSSWGSYYHRWLQRVYGFLIPKGSRVLELGCGCGDLLASLQPDYGVGIDFSPYAISKARINHPSLHFELMDAESLELGTEQFDYIILSDIVNDLGDVQTMLKGATPHCHPGSRLVMNSYSHLWRIPLQIAQGFGWQPLQYRKTGLQLRILETSSPLSHSSCLTTGLKWLYRLICQVPACSTVF